MSNDNNGLMPTVACEHPDDDRVGREPDRITVLIPVSAGELLDKLSILRLKASRVTDPNRREHVEHELRALEAVRRKAVAPDPRTAALEEALAKVNAELWELEDAVRDYEARGDFAADFVASARAIYGLNDRRAALKRELNRLTGSTIIEEKIHPGGQRP